MQSPEPELGALLGRLRAARGFDVSEVAAAKQGRLLTFFRESGLDAAVVGVSGGVDSALVLALLESVRRRPGSALRRVVALLLPIAGHGATGQAEALRRGRGVAEALGAEIWEAPLGDALAATLSSLSRAAGLPFEAWAEGQCLSVMRTPALYGAAALLQQHGYRSLVVGTTNRDEGAYLGFFGKASDGMVDLQPISDLHKSEVRALARHLAVPEEIVVAPPRGDVFDGRTDEQMIGASYDAVEAVLRLKELGRDAALAGAEALAAVERLHAQNRHKYAVGSPAHHLDVLPRGVPGGWVDTPLSGRGERRPPPGVLLGEWEPPAIELDAVSGVPEVEGVAAGGFALRAPALLSQADCARLERAFRAAGGAEAVGVNGTPDSAGQGSYRRTAWAPELARALWLRACPCVPSVRFLDAFSPTDGFATAKRRGHRSWRAVGLSPILRFMRYEPGGAHAPHYDAGYDYGDGRRTLLSVIFFLTDGSGSGATRFIADGQDTLPSAARDFADWPRAPRADEVLVRCEPVAGAALVFDHRLCHDVEHWDGPGARLSIRADVVYEAVVDGRE